MVSCMRREYGNGPFLALHERYRAGHITYFKQNFFGIYLI